nr:Chain B, Paktide S [synthetic construct]4JDK_B Chain B, Paktide S [synthetic construct]
RRRRSWY